MDAAKFLNFAQEESFMTKTHVSAICYKAISTLFPAHKKLDMRTIEYEANRLMKEVNFNLQFIRKLS